MDSQMIKDMYNPERYGTKGVIQNVWGIKGDMRLLYIEAIF